MTRTKRERLFGVRLAGDTLTIREGERVDTYTLLPIPSEIGGRGFSLVKPDGEVYDVLLLDGESSCTCPGNIYHGRCKHQACLRGLATAGRI